SGIRGLAGFFFKNAKPLDEETMEEWSNRIFGEEITYNLIEPALGGIYSTPLSKMSPEMVFSNFSLHEDRSFFKAVKSRPKSQKPKIRGLISFQNGMQELVDKLSTYLEADKNCTIELNTNSINLAKIRSEKIYNAVRICLPIQSAYKLCFSDTASKVFLEKHSIQEPNYHSIATLTRFSEESIFSKPAFGVLFPKNSPIKANGVLSNDSIFPGRTLKEGIFSETWIYSGDWLKDTNEIALQSILEEDRIKIMKKGLMNKSIAVYSKKWIDSFPVYDDNLLNFNACLDEVEEYHSTNHKPVQFYGNYRKGIGLRSLIENALKG
ncbi:MAG: hypothetical protein JJT78_07480, partial [Leptospira sp.]|nr:hypothetical protein [Leptospira sp.]